MIPLPPSGTQLTEEMRAVCESMGRKYGVAPDIHEQDFLLKFILKKVGPDGLKAYFEGGRGDAVKFGGVVDRLFPGRKDLKILEFASGYGRVTRHLKGLLAGHRLVSSDIHPEACRFIAERVGVETRASATTPEDLDVGDEYDLIVVLSLFSHLPHSTFGRWLAALYSRLNVGGYLVVTANGQTSIEKFPGHYLPPYDARRGYGYIRKSDQEDLDVDDYGSMVVSIPYFGRTVFDAIPTAKIVSFTAGTWFGNQDEWVIQRRESAPSLPPERRSLRRRLKKGIGKLLG